MTQKKRKRKKKLTQYQIYKKNRPESQTPLYKMWLYQVIKRCRGRCVVCGQCSRICHHLNSWNLYISERYNPLNGVVLCWIHHNNFHKLYGRGNNTKEQFAAYLFTYYNKDLKDFL